MPEITRNSALSQISKLVLAFSFLVTPVLGQNISQATIHSLGVSIESSNAMAQSTIGIPTSYWNSRFDGSDDIVLRNKTFVRPTLASDKLLIGGDLDSVHEVLIVDLVAKVVLRHSTRQVNQINLNISALNKGVYFVKIIHQTTGQSETHKFIKI